MPVLPKVDGAGSPGEDGGDNDTEEDYNRPKDLDELEIPPRDDGDSSESSTPIPILPRSNPIEPKPELQASSPYRPSFRQMVANPKVVLEPPKKRKNTIKLNKNLIHRKRNLVKPPELVKKHEKSPSRSRSFSRTLYSRSESANA